MTSLTDFSDEELRAELERRKRRHQEQIEKDAHFNLQEYADLILEFLRELAEEYKQNQASHLHCSDNFFDEWFKHEISEFDCRLHVREHNQDNIAFGCSIRFRVDKNEMD
jgi:hypothetical protein